MCGMPHVSRRTSTALSKPASRTVPLRTARRVRAESRSEDGACAANGAATSKRRNARFMGPHGEAAACAVRTPAALSVVSLLSLCCLSVVSLSDDVSDPSPPDIRNERQRLVGLVLRHVRVVDEDRASADVLPWDESPVA